LKGSCGASDDAASPNPDRRRDRAASILADEILRLWDVIAEQSGMATQASALSAES